MTLEFAFRARIWRYDGASPWHFVTLPKSAAASIQSAASGHTKAFGSVKVIAVIGQTRWKTSLFPDRTSGSYLLPVKAAVRQREQLQAGETIEVILIAEH